MVSAGSGRTRFLLPLPRTRRCAFARGEILELKVEHLTGTQAIEEHEGDDGEIAKGAKAFPETGDFIGRKRNDHATGLPEAQTAGDSTLRTAVAERGSRRIGALEMGVSPGNLTVRNGSDRDSAVRPDDD